MRKPVWLAVVVACGILAIAAGVLLVQNQKTSSDLAVARTAQQKAEGEYAQTIDAIAEIQDSLNALSISDTTLGGREWNQENAQKVSGTGSQEVLDRIALLRAGLARNRERLQELEANLKKSGVKVAGLQKMVKNLKTTMAEKEEMIAQLSTRVDSLQTQVTTLATTVQQTQDTLQVRDQQVEDKRRELATVYYIVGSKNDLKHAGVVQSKGGMLGIGKTLVPTTNANTGLFTSVDTDAEKVIYTSSPKARVLTAQPMTSYQLMLVDGKMELHITDPTEFRKVRELVILTG